MTASSAFGVTPRAAGASDLGDSEIALAFYEMPTTFYKSPTQRTHHQSHLRSTSLIGTTHAHISVSHHLRHHLSFSPCHTEHTHTHPLPFM